MDIAHRTAADPAFRADVVAGLAAPIVSCSIGMRRTWRGSPEAAAR